MTLPDVNLLDILLVIIAGISIVTGFIAGFARVGIGFIAMVSGILFGFWFYGIPAAWIHRYIHSAAVSNLLGFFAVFSAFVMLGSLIGKLLSKLFKWTGLSWLDRLMGGAFGLVRGSLMAIAFVAVLLAFTPKPLPRWIVESRVLPYAVDASNLCAELAPNGLKDAFREGLQDIRRAWDEQIKGRKKKPASEIV